MQKNCIWEGITLHLSRLDLRGSSTQKAEDGARLFTVGHDRRMGDNKHKLKQEKFKADIRKTFFIFSTFSLFFLQDFLAVEQVAQRGCAVFILVGFQYKAQSNPF